MGVLGGDNRRDTALAWLFVAVQFALLVVIVVLPPGDAWPVPPWLDTLGLGSEVLGAVVLVAGIINLGRSLTPLPTPIDHAVLKAGGLYRWVRHPIYSGIIALVVGVSLRSASVAVAAAPAGLIGWFMLKARWEEHSTWPAATPTTRPTPNTPPGSCRSGILHGVHDRSRRACRRGTPAPICSPVWRARSRPSPTRCVR